VEEEPLIGAENVEEVAGDKALPTDGEEVEGKPLDGSNEEDDDASDDDDGRVRLIANVVDDDDVADDDDGGLRLRRRAFGLSKSKDIA